MNYYVLLGGPENLRFFERREAYAGRAWLWTMVKDARVGESCFVYLSAPVSRFVGRFKVKAEPFYHVGTTMFSHPQLRDTWVAKVGDVEYFTGRPELAIKRLRELFPDWGWLRYPRGKTRIPDEVLKPFLELMR